MLRRAVFKSLAVLGLGGCADKTQPSSDDQRFCARGRAGREGGDPRQAHRYSDRSRRIHLAR